MWELNHKEIWAPKNCCFWTVVLEKTLESPLDCKEIKKILKEISPRIYNGLKTISLTSGAGKSGQPLVKEWIIALCNHMNKPSVQFSCSVVSDSLQPHESQHTRPPCPSPTPRVYSNSCPSNRWCHPTISSSVVPFSSHPQCFPASGSFPRSQFFPSGSQSIGVSASTSVLPMNTQDWSPLGWTCWISLQSKGLSRVFSNTTVEKHQFFGQKWYGFNRSRRY